MVVLYNDHMVTGPVSGHIRTTDQIGLIWVYTMTFSTWQNAREGLLLLISSAQRRGKSGGEYQ